METLLRNIGNSKGVVLPAQLLKELGMQVGDKLDVTAADGKLVIAPTDKRQQYKLADLLAKCDPSAPMPQELADWDAAPTVGIEA
jgi:antitoxin component of MazEF toxin-antitoxin module